MQKLSKQDERDAIMFLMGIAIQDFLEVYKSGGDDDEIFEALGDVEDAIHDLHSCLKLKKPANIEEANFVTMPSDVYQILMDMADSIIK